MKCVLYKNSYPSDFVDKCIKEFLNSVLTPKIVVSTLPKKDCIIVDYSTRIFGETLALNSHYFKFAHKFDQSCNEK